VLNHKIDEQYFGALLDAVGRDQGESIRRHLCWTASKEATKCTLGLTHNRMSETRLRPVLLLATDLKRNAMTLLTEKIAYRAVARLVMQPKKNARTKTHSAKEHK
jgi:hypothetical protein